MLKHDQPLLVSRVECHCERPIDFDLEGDGRSRIPKFTDPDRVLHVGTVTRTLSRLRNDLKRILVLRNDDERRPIPPVSEQGARLARGRRLESGAVENRERAVPGVVAQRAAEGGPAGLAVDLDLEAAHARWKREPAARPVRRSRRPGASATGAFLTPRLRPTTGDEAAALPAARARAGGVQLCPHRLVDQVRLELGGEDRASSETSFFCPPRTGALGAAITRS